MFRLVQTNPLLETWETSLKWPAGECRHSQEEEEERGATKENEDEKSSRYKNTTNFEQKKIMFSLLTAEAEHDIPHLSIMNTHC